MTKREHQFFTLVAVAPIALLGFTLFGVKLIGIEEVKMVWSWGIFFILGSLCGLVMKICQRKLKQ